MILVKLDFSRMQPDLVTIVLPFNKKLNFIFRLMCVEWVAAMSSLGK